MEISTNKLSNKWHYLSICLLAFFPIFYQLGADVIHIWDEAIYANNALEMLNNGKIWVLFNNGEPSLYNTKPPLAIWLQALSMKFFGVNEWAVRLPSALAALGTCLILFHFVRKWCNVTVGYLGVLFLLTSNGFVQNHVALSGDLDAVLCFFITAYTLFALDFFLDENEKKYSSLKFSLIFLSLLMGAFFTKSVAAFLPLPGLFIIGVLRWRKTIEVVRNPTTWIAVIVFFSSIIIYYLWRESLATGYWDKVFFSEFQRLTDDIMPWHKHPWWFYLRYIYRYDLPYWIWLTPIGFLGFFDKSEKIRDLSKFAWIYIIAYLVFISLPPTKLHWYTAPIFPIVAILLGLGTYLLWKKIVTYFQGPNMNLVGFTLVLLLFALPYYYINPPSTKPEDPLEWDGYAVRELNNQGIISDYHVLRQYDYPEHSDQLRFYMKQQNWYNDGNLSLETNLEKLSINDRVLCSQQNLLDSLAQFFTLDTIARVHHSYLIELR